MAYLQIRGQSLIKDNKMCQQVFFRLYIQRLQLKVAVIIYLNLILRW